MWFFSTANANPYGVIHHLYKNLSEKEHTHTHTHTQREREHTNIPPRGHWVQVKGVGSHHSQSLRVGHRSNTFPNAMLMCSWWQWCSWREGIHSIPQASKHLHQNTDGPRGAVTQSHDTIMSPLKPHISIQNTTKESAWQQILKDPLRGEFTTSKPLLHILFQWPAASTHKPG